MIHDLRVSKDEADFPVVSWTESRNAHSPQGVGSARVECRIMKDGTTGELLFVARGTVRDPYGKFEEGKPWEKLRGFSEHAAEGLYLTKGRDRVLEACAAKKSRCESGRSATARLSCRPSSGTTRPFTLIAPMLRKTISIGCLPRFCGNLQSISPCLSKNLAITVSLAGRRRQLDHVRSGPNRVERAGQARPYPGNVEG